MAHAQSSVPPGAETFPHCVEHGIWTPLLDPPPERLSAYTLRLRDVHPRESARIRLAGAMTFHMVGCAGSFEDHAPQRAVAAAMASQVERPDSPSSGDAQVRPASFLYLLGDVVYKDDNKLDEEGTDQRLMYNTQFYQAYRSYPRRIFAIAGNHDGKRTSDRRTSALEHFQRNFCAPRPGPSPDNQTDQRAAMSQPYPYWRLTTPTAYILGLYSNIANGGILDDPARPHEQPQYRWLVAQLADMKQRNARRRQRRAILLAIHYPPFSGAANFTQRGDPTLGPSQASETPPLATVLQRAFAESGQRPDAVFSAHAHLYQRLTYRHADGWEAPYLVAGCGGHGPIEPLWETCDKKKARPKKAPFAAVLPAGQTLPAHETVQVMAYNDASFGFLRVTVAANLLLGEFFTVDGATVALADSFRLDLASHRLG